MTARRTARRRWRRRRRIRRRRTAVTLTMRAPRRRRSWSGSCRRRERRASPCRPRMSPRTRPPPRAARPPARPHPRAHRPTVHGRRLDAGSRSTPSTRAVRRSALPLRRRRRDASGRGRLLGGDVTDDEFDDAIGPTGHQHRAGRVFVGRRDDGRRARGDSSSRGRSRSALAVAAALVDPGQRAPCALMRARTAACHRRVPRPAGVRAQPSSPSARGSSEMPASGRLGPIAAAASVGRCAGVARTALAGRRRRRVRPLLLDEAARVGGGLVHDERLVGGRREQGHETRGVSLHELTRPERRALRRRSRRRQPSPVASPPFLAFGSLNPPEHPTPRKHKRNGILWSTLADHSVVAHERTRRCPAIRTGRVARVDPHVGARMCRHSLSSKSVVTPSCRASARGERRRDGTPSRPRPRCTATSPPLAADKVQSVLEDRCRPAHRGSRLPAHRLRLAGREGLTENG